MDGSGGYSLSSSLFSSRIVGSCDCVLSCECDHCVDCGLPIVGVMDSNMGFRCAYIIKHIQKLCAIVLVFLIDKLRRRKRFNCVLIRK